MVRLSPAVRPSMEEDMSRRDGSFGDTIAVVIGWCAGMALVIMFLMAITSQEDDPMFNCYISGDMRCGETAVWHGFVNF